MNAPDVSPERISSLFYSIHATTRDTAAWPEALGKLRDWLDGRWTTLAVHDFDSGQGRILHQAPQDPDLSLAYAGIATRNPWFLSSDEYAPGTIVAGEDLIANRDLVRTDFYRHLLRPHRLLHRLCGVAARRGELIYYVAVHREDGQAAFSVADRENFHTAVSHFALALENDWHGREHSDLNRAMRHIADQTSVATYLVDADGRILFKNRTATELSGAGLEVQDGRLCAATPSDARALRQALQAALDESETASRVLTISTLDGGHPTVVSVSPAGSAFIRRVGVPCPVAVVSARNQHTPHNQCSFARQFDFTPAQTRLSSLLFTGHSLGSAARQLHVSENTVRSHLKQIFQKTNTHSQMELVHLHSRICVDIDGGYVDLQQGSA